MTFQKRTVGNLRVNTSLSPQDRADEEGRVCTA